MDFFERLKEINLIKLFNMYLFILTDCEVLKELTISPKKIVTIIILKISFGADSNTTKLCLILNFLFKEKLYNL